MKMRAICSVLLPWLLVGVVHAQVYKCQDAQGRIIYSDSLCDYAAKAVDPSRLRGNSLDTSESRRQVQENERAQQQVSERAQQQAARLSATGGTGGGNRCPSEQEIKNLETSASSLSLDKKRKEREFLQAEIRRARACAKEGGNYTDADWKRIKDEQAAQFNLSGRSREDARAAAKSVHAPSASDRENQRMQTDEFIEAQRRGRICNVIGPNLVNCN